MLEVTPSPGDTPFRVEPVKLRPLKEAMVTVGGVDLNDVHPDTMESRSVPGLYFAGEVLDVDGPTGGYNLTAAFATARLAVASIATAAGIEVRSSPSTRSKPRRQRKRKPKKTQPRQRKRGPRGDAR